MKLSTASRGVETNVSDSDSTTMGIENNAHMFSLLSDKLYTDKPRAIWREICCNAYDAAPDRPFLVSIPSRSDPTLTIRDFGPGMPHEFMMGGYTRVGHSTKNQDNNSVGGFGIGRMAIFSYANEYTVTSITGRTKRIYLVYRADNGLPAVTLVDTSITDEASGVEIKMPIRAYDYDRFVHTGRDVLRWFPPGSFETFGFTVEHPKVLVAGQRYRLYLGVEHNLVQVGPVTYRHDLDLPPQIVPVFAVGEISPAPNRESLSLDAKTIELLNQRVADIKSQLPRDVIDQANDMTPTQRVRLVDKLKANYAVRLIFHNFPGHQDVPYLFRGEILPHRSQERIEILAREPTTAGLREAATSATSPITSTRSTSPPPMLWRRHTSSTTSPPSVRHVSTTGSITRGSKRGWSIRRRRCRT